MTVPISTPPHQFTAAQIARALGRDRTTILSALEGVRATGEVKAGGRQASAWAICELPTSLQDRLEARSAKSGCRNSVHLLHAASEPWQPSIPWHEVTSENRRRAEKLQRALAPALARLHDDTVRADEFNQRGVEDYAREFDYTISERHWRRVFDRTVERAGSAEEWERRELYLEDAVCPMPTSQVARAEEHQAFAELLGVLRGFSNPHDPTPDEQTYFLDCAFVLLDESTQTQSSKSFKAALLSFLQRHAPFLSRNAKALRRHFNRLYRRWKEAGCQISAIDDHRAGRARGPEVSAEDFKMLVAYCAKFGGGLNQGWREAIREAKLSQELVSYYSRQGRHMPRKIRELVRGHVEDVKTRLHGPRHAVLRGPYINRDPNHPANPLASGSWDSADDLTLPNVWYEETPDGLWCGQGQFIAWVDERSWLIYNFVLISDRAYNAFHIRNSWTKKCDQHGLPREGLYLEMGIWKNARVWMGRKDGDEVSWPETEMGIRRLGLRVQHAKYPRGKIIERLFGKLQNYFQSEPGYVGRDPVKDKYEEVQKQIRLVKSGKVHPSEFFYSKAEWVARLADWCHRLNHEPAGGKYLDGLSPVQAYEKFFSTQLVKVPEECRYLLASNKIETKIGTNGISFQFGAQRFNYKDERLGELRLQNPDVIAWFNPESPDVLGVTDANGENPIVVKRETSVPSHDAPVDLLAQAQGENAAQERYAKDFYRSLKPIFSQEFDQRRFRDVVTDGVAVETGRVLKQQTESVVAEAREQARLEQRARKLVQQSNVPLPSSPARRRTALEAQDKIERILAKVFNEDDPK